MVDYLNNLHKVKIPKFVKDYQTPSNTDWDEVLAWFAVQGVTVFEGRPDIQDRFVVVFENLWYCCYFSDAGTAMRFKLKFLKENPQDNPNARPL